MRRPCLLPRPAVRRALPAAGGVTVVLALALALCVPAAWAVQGDEPVGTSGPVSVTQQEVQALVALLPAARREQLSRNPAELEQWVRARLADKQLQQEAAAQQWAQRPEVARQIEAATRQLVALSYLASVSQAPSDYPSEPELAAAYNRLKGGLLKPAGYRVSQVFIPAPLGDPAAQAAARRAAGEVTQKARKPKADFSRLAAEYGKGAAQPPADTGWVTLDQLLPEVRPVVASLKPGQVSEPVQSAAGLHVLKLVAVREAQQATLEETRDRLRARMRQERQEQIARAYLDGLANGASVKVDVPAMKRILEHAPSSSSPPSSPSATP